MHRQQLSIGRTARVLSLAALGVCGCGAGAATVPEKTQRASEERYGEQQMFMSDLNATPAEQAAARHENSTRPVERPGSEKKPPGQ
ncbi:MAG TPA: hypothetical protein VLC09_07525 [Polyangiaceae bacterium]|nr:hypothetical protein [Polyangiaceae bacterium]